MSLYLQVPTFVATAMVLTGIGLLSASLFSFLNIQQLVKSRRLRAGWVMVVVLDLTFILCSLAVVNIRLQAVATHFDLIVALMMFLGLTRVISVAFLSQRTARDIQLIATLKHDVYWVKLI